MACSSARRIILIGLAITMSAACARSDWRVLRDDCDGEQCELPCNAAQDCDPSRSTCVDPPQWSSCSSEQLCVMGACVESSEACTYYVDVGTVVPDHLGTAAAPFVSIQAAVDAADAAGAAGAAICVSAGLYDEEVRVSASGTATSYLSVVARGVAIVRSIAIWADFVEVSGFEFTHAGSSADLREGISVVGQGAVIFDNVFHDLNGAGIICSESEFCDGAVITFNELDGAVPGIRAVGDNLRIAHNQLRGPGGGHGIVFFGRAHDIAYNRIDGYDTCLQTWVMASVSATAEVEIRGNVCSNTVNNCMSAVGDPGTALGTSSIRFSSNVCDGLGSGVIELQDMPGAIVSNNVFVGSGQRVAVHVMFGSENARIINNVFLGAFDEHYILGSGDAVADYNLAYAETPGDLPAEWSEVHGLWAVEPQFEGLSSDALLHYRPGPDSPLIDAGDGTSVGPLDLIGRARVLDGDDDGQAVVDIGPVER